MTFTNARNRIIATAFAGVAIAAAVAVPALVDDHTGGASSILAKPAEPAPKPPTAPTTLAPEPPRPVNPCPIPSFCLPDKMR